MAIEHLHPAIVHFTIALFITSVVFDILWYLKKNDRFRVASWYNLIVGGIAAILSVQTGLLAEENIVLSASAIEIFEIHENLAFIVIISLLAQLFWRMGMRGKMPDRFLFVYYIIGVIGLSSTIATAYYGGKLVYELGVGVKAQQTTKNSTKVESSNSEKDLIRKNIQFVKPDSLLQN